MVSYDIGGPEIKFPSKDCCIADWKIPPLSPRQGLTCLDDNLLEISNVNSAACLVNNIDEYLSQDHHWNCFVPCTMSFGYSKHIDVIPRDSSWWGFTILLLHLEIRSGIMQPFLHSFRRCSVPQDDVQLSAMSSFRKLNKDYQEKWVMNKAWNYWLVSFHCSFYG